MPTPKYDEARDLWTIRFRVKEKGIDVNKRLTGETKKKCQQAYVDFMSEYIPDYSIRDERVFTFGELANEYLKSNRQRWKESTYLTVKGRLDNTILPYFQNMTAQKIKPSDIQGWQNGLCDYSFKYKQTVRVLLSSVFKYGERIYDLKSPMAKVDGFRDTETKELNFWTPEEFNSFIKSCDDAMKLFFRFLFVSGCRKGEALGIQKGDIVGNTVHISKSITWKCEGARWDVTTPKNKQSIRDVVMPADIIREMKETEGKWVFGGAEPYNSQHIDRAFLKGIRESGVKKIRIHDLRHSSASLLLSKGASVVEVAKRLGHKDVKMTLNVYAHVMPNEQEKMVKLFDGV